MKVTLLDGQALPSSHLPHTSRASRCLGLLGYRRYRTRLERGRGGRSVGADQAPRGSYAHCFVGTTQTVYSTVPSLRTHVNPGLTRGPMPADPRNDTIRFKRTGEHDRNLFSEGSGLLLSRAFGNSSGIRWRCANWEDWERANPNTVRRLWGQATHRTA